MLESFISQTRCCLFVIILLLGGCQGHKNLAQSPDAPPSEHQTRQIHSQIYTIDRIYPSMVGPQSTEEIRLGDPDNPELIWITGYRAVMVDPDGEPLSQEFMCHSNMDIDIHTHRELFGWKQFASRRLFTLSQGQYEIQFPEGFGIPVLSNEAFSVTTQVLNLNDPDIFLKARHRVTIQYVRDSDLAEPMKPLLMKAANGLVLIEGDSGHYNVADPDEEKHGPGCMLGEGANSRYRTDRFGRKFTGHWLVKPGRQENHTLVTEWMNLPYDTTVHYIGVHLHPFAESLTLRDLTSGETVFESRVSPSPGRIGIDHVDYFSSEEGIPLYADHQYELVSVYNNTTEETHDSMAVMYLYVLDREFDKSKLPVN